MDSSSTLDLSIDLRPLTTTKKSSHKKNDNVDENTVALHRLGSLSKDDSHDNDKRQNNRFNHR